MYRYTKQRLTTKSTIVTTGILLLFSFVAEASPFRFTQTFWNYAFPAYSDSFSTAPLGFIMLIIGCSILSHA